MTVIDAAEISTEERRADVRRSCESVFLKHNDKLIRFAATRVGSWDLACELVQSAYEKIFAQQAPPPFKFLRAYVYKAVATLCLDAIKQRKNRSGRQTEIYDALYASHAEVVTPERGALTLQVRELLNTALVNLAPRERMAFTLVEMQGATVREAAEAMKATEPYVYQLIGRAYADLARAVSKLECPAVKRRYRVRARKAVPISE
jgi:RNA polymerase sigma factor (sigma-70 family)